MSLKIALAPVFAMGGGCVLELGIVIVSIMSESGLVRFVLTHHTNMTIRRVGSHRSTNHNSGYNPRETLKSKTFTL